MPTIRKITVYRIRLSSGRELLLEEQEAKETGDALVDRLLVGTANQRRLAFGDIALEGQRPTLRPTLERKRR